MRKTGAQILIDELIHQGVDTVFGYPGGAVLDIYDQLYQHSDEIKHVLTAHEQGAAHAADGYARVSGRPGVVIATSGPGATNLVTGIANAYLDSVPLVAITGNVSTEMLGKDSFQEVDIVGITQPIVKHNYIVRDVKYLQSILREAFSLATTGRPGPVLIDLPKGVQKAECEVKMPVDACQGIQTVSDKQRADVGLQADLITEKKHYQQALQAIRNSRRPFIYAGGGVIASGAEEMLLALSQKIEAPIGFSLMGISALPSSYPLNLGVCGMHGRYASSRAQAECDLMIAVGVRFSDRATGDISEYTKGRTVIHIDIDYAEIRKNVPSAINLCGDAKQVIMELLNQLAVISHPMWRETVLAYKQEENFPMEQTFNPKLIIERVAEYFDKNTVVATDVGQHQMWTMQFYPFERSRRLLTSGGLGTMGYGFGAAIGGCLANQSKPTLFITSEGSFGMNLNEFATAVSQQLPILVLLLNNNALGMVRQWQRRFYGQRYSQTTLNRQTDFICLAEAFGAKGYRATNQSELETSLESYLADGGPCLIDCHIHPDERVLPMIPPGKSINQIIVR